MGANFQVSFHEAGHAFMAWYFGVRLRKVVALADREFARQRWLKLHGGKVQKGSPGVTEHFDDMFSRKIMHSGIAMPDLKRLCRVRVYIALAGPINTEKVTGLNLQQCLATSGWSDKVMIDSCCILGKINKLEYSGIIVNVRKIMKTQRAQAAVADIVCLLLQGGTISGERIDSLCKARYGISSSIRKINSEKISGRGSR